MVFLTLLLFFLYFFVAFLVDCLPFIPLIRKMGETSSNSLQIIKSEDIEDSEKEKMLLSNSLKMFGGSAKILGLLIVTSVFVVLLVWLICIVLKINYHEIIAFSISIPGLIISVVSFTSYFLLKKLYGKLRL